MPRAPKKPLDRDAWLRKALDVLFANGISQIKVEVLARKLKLTKGSFYWHFKNRDELLRSMVDWWRDQQLSFIARLAVQQVALSVLLVVHWLAWQVRLPLNNLYLRL